MKMLLIVSVLLVAPWVAADVSPENVEQMLQQMVKENVISASEAEKAKVKMKNMNQDQWGKINNEALKVAAQRSPASVSPESSNSIQEVNGLDLDGAQFKQIQNDIKKIMPEYRE